MVTVMVEQEATINQFLDWFQMASLVCLVCFLIGRGAVLYTRGVRVVVIDGNRSANQTFVDLLLVACVLLWGVTVVAYAWPVQSLANSSGPGVVLLDTIVTKVVGAGITTAALLIYIFALLAFGQSWRVGIDRRKPGPLVTEGVFSWTRNPIYVSVELFIFGTFLMEGRMIHLVLALLIAGMTHALILREERFLVDTYGQAYREYAQRVGRYLDWRVINRQLRDTFRS